MPSPSREPSPPPGAEPSSGTRRAAAAPGALTPLGSVARGLTRLLGALPLAANRAVGTLLGRATWLARGRSRRVTETNVALCFPELDASARGALVRAALVEQGRALAELGWCWHRTRPELETRIRRIDGRKPLYEALRGARGALLVTPHFGMWELSALIPAGIAPLAYFYRPPRRPAFDPLLVEGRRNLGGEPLRLDAGGIREALRRLKAGSNVGILPDQEPDREGGAFAPFFGVPALTMTLLPRLARRSGARVLFVCVERLPGGTGWRYHCIEPVGDVAAADPVEAATAVNRSIEACVRIAPAQYLWSYRRFRELPGGGRRPYR